MDPRTDKVATNEKEQCQVTEKNWQPKIHYHGTREMDERQILFYHKSIKYG